MTKFRIYNYISKEIFCQGKQRHQSLTSKLFFSVDLNQKKCYTYLIHLIALHVFFYRAGGKMKVGIITHYYDSQNFGGNLQAYALCEFLNKQGIDAEQISFIYKKETDNVPKIHPRANLPFYKKILRKDLFKVIQNKIYYYRRRKWAEKQEKKYDVTNRRQKAFENFNKLQIPHSEKVYSRDNIEDCVSSYDAFITGSDQVWNFTWYFKAFFLDFVPSDKTKISYAASISMSELSDDQKLILKNSLKDFDAVSVREKSAIELIKDFSNVPVVETLDPTLLLEKSDWDKISSERLIDEEYVFCYFLGESKENRKLAKQYARKNKLKLVYIPHAGGWLKCEDQNFGDIKLFDATPNDFISLIKHAKCVLTDSFHAVVFSSIYEKDFFVFNRSENGEMSSRIIDITNMLGVEERYCPDKQRMNIKYMSSLAPVDFSKNKDIFKAKKQSSIEFLKNSLKKN